MIANSGGKQPISEKYIQNVFMLCNVLCYMFVFGYVINVVFLFYVIMMYDVYYKCYMSHNCYQVASLYVVMPPVPSIRTYVPPDLISRIREAAPYQTVFFSKTGWVNNQNGGQ